MVVATGFSAEFVGPQSFPRNAADLQKYEAVILANVNPDDFTQEEIKKR